MAKPKAQTKRYLGLDLSLSPGLAVIDVKGRIPTLVYAGSVATDTNINHAARSVVVESFIAQNVYEYMPFDIVLREDFTSGKNKDATRAVFNSWTAADRALNVFGYEAAKFKKGEHLTPTTVKKAIGGSGRADKEDVAKGVRRLLRLPDDYPFKDGNDDSDACAVILTYLLRENLIDAEVAAA
ncbi:crossover junction endodeoxyribonuclease RuvC [Paenibacillus xylanexedens]|uniref:crossover junction endodeoxyribonuclease RuvC n=1 Tax=Paenibacillus xylanexedens TaxID=528191 RepID=UPI0021B56C3E|nr:crossover junction endodeoxyribonuclease RuvC [Paenibacillus xylanexedens]